MRSRAGLTYAFVMIVARALGGTVYVNGASGNDAWDGFCETFSGGTCGPKKTIQAGINAAANGDLVLVAAGTYQGTGNVNLGFNTKTITLRAAGIGACIINCQSSTRGFRFNLETPGSVLEGFTIRRGTGTTGAGIRCRTASPTIRNCVIETGNGTDGVGIACETGSSPRIENCIIRDNLSTTGRGGAVDARDAGSAPVLVNCVIYGNQAQRGAAVGALSGSVTLVNCTVTGNLAGVEGGGIYLDSSTADVVNSIFWSNNAPAGDEIALRNSTGASTLMVDYCDVNGGQAGILNVGGVVLWNAGNIVADPQFASSRKDLLFTSPCVEAGTNSPAVGLPATDIDGKPRIADANLDGSDIVDMGAFEAPRIEFVEVSPTSLYFDAYLGDPPPPAQNLSIRGQVVGPLHWSVTPNCPWLHADPLSGESAGETDLVAVSVDHAGMLGGTYACTLTVVGPEAPNSPVTVTVQLRVRATLRVPSSYATIQDAIDAAMPGDTVFVEDGVFTGPRNRNLDFGGKGIRVRSEHGAAYTTIDCENAGRAFVFDHSEPETAIIDGLTITNGAERQGGGVYAGFQARPTIQNCVFRACTATQAGGAMAFRTATATVRDCVVSDCTAQSAGAVYSSDSAAVTLWNCLIENNSCPGVGAIEGSNGSVDIESCVVRRNRSTDNWIAGISVQTGTGGLVARNSLIEENGGVDGGRTAIYVAGHSALIENCAIVRNYSSDRGAAISSYFTESLIITGCTISGNVAAREAGAIDIAAGTTPTITNCIIWDNRSRDGSQIHLYDWYNSYTLIVDHSCIQGGRSGINVDSPTWTIDWRAGNVESDPRLTRFGWHIQGNSPCIDVGNPGAVTAGATDADAEPRVAGAAVDIGADEFWEVDADQMPDWWESSHFGSATAADPLGDPDSDGRTNVEEYTLGADPLRPVRTYFVSTAGDDAWDGLANSWTGLSGPKHTIQAAIDLADAFEGDTVVVLPGTHRGDGNRDIDFHGKAMTVRGSDPANHAVQRATVIDCESSGGANEHRAFNFVSRETQYSILEGLTIINGNAPLVFLGQSYQRLGGAVLCRGSGPTIRNCTFERNIAFGGGALATVDARVDLSDCAFRNGNIAEYGGAVNVSSSAGTIRRCRFEVNRAYYGGHVAAGNARLTIANSTFAAGYALSSGGAIDARGSVVTLENNVFRENHARDSGGGVYASECKVRIAHCNILDNWAYEWGGGVWVRYDFSQPTDPDQCVVVNSIFRGNRSRHQGPELVIWETTGSVAYCNIDGGQRATDTSSSTIVWGPGNIDADPRFAFSRDHHLMPDSPCVDAGANLATLPIADFEGRPRALDGDGDSEARPDIGAYEFNPAFPAAALSNDDLRLCRYLKGPSPVIPLLYVRSAGGPPLSWTFAAPGGTVIPPSLSGVSAGEILSFKVFAAGALPPVGDYLSNAALDGDGDNCPRPIDVTVHVGTTRLVPQDYPSIGAAVGAAAMGDLVLVADGVWSGPGNHDISVYAKDIEIRSAGGRGHCTIDLQNAGRAFSVGDTTRKTIIRGFTILNGRADQGGGVRFDGSAGAVLQDCEFRNCVATQDGGAIAVGTINDREKDTPLIESCLIDFNRALRNGGGIATGSGSPTISNCVIRDNIATVDGGGVYFGASTMGRLTNTAVIRNSCVRNGGGVCSPSYHTPITQCTIAANSAAVGGGVYASGAYAYRARRLYGSILWGNVAPLGAPLALVSNADLSLAYCDVEGLESKIYVEAGSVLDVQDGNFEADPLFRADGYRIVVTSPCVDAGDYMFLAREGETDVENQPRIMRDRVDIGADEVPWAGFPLDSRGDGAFGDPGRRPLP